MTLKANIASVITGTDDMEAQCTLWIHKSKLAVIVRRKFISKHLTFPHEKSLEPGRVVSQNLDISTKEMCTEEDLLVPDCLSHQQYLPRKSFNLDTPSSTIGPHI